MGETERATQALSLPKHAGMEGTTLHVSNVDPALVFPGGQPVPQRIVHFSQRL